MPDFYTLRPCGLSYDQALQLQQRLVDERPRRGADTLMLLQHAPVVTLGRGANDSHLLLPQQELARRGVECHRVGRGGDVTFHGPGQLVGYPIVDLELVGRDLHRFLRLLEATLVATLAAFGVAAERVAGATGVWVGGEKIASIGLGVRRWVSWHGFALNVGADLSGFDAIVPCGLPGVSMTSLERLLGRVVPMAEVETRIIENFGRSFGLTHAGEYVLKDATQTDMA